MKKRLTALALLTVLLAGGIPAQAAGGEESMPTAAQPAHTGRFALPAFDVSAKAAMLICQDTGDVLYMKEPDRELPIASITKVMTLLLTMEAIEAGKIALTDIVPVSEHAYSMGGSQIWLEPGEEFTLDEMLRAVCISSANDAAVAVAEYVGGSEPVFVEMMNQKVAALGLSHTHFANACGLDAQGHYSSARDVALLSREILEKYPQVTGYTTVWMDSLRNGATQLLNTNKLLKRYAGTTGLKTGTTGGAGVCITASAEREGLSLIAVVLGCASSAERFADAEALLDYGFANFEAAPFPGGEALPRQIAVTGGKNRQLPLCFQSLPETVLLKKGEEDSLKAQVFLPDLLTAPVQQGAVLGEVKLSVGGETLGSWPVTAGQGVEKMDFSTAFTRLLRAVGSL